MRRLGHHAKPIFDAQMKGIKMVTYMKPIYWGYRIRGKYRRYRYCRKYYYSNDQIHWRETLAKNAFVNHLPPF